MQNKKGFSLIESAIVLGVVGLVIGGIWVAAASIRENMLINKTVQGTGIIVDNMRRMYAGIRIPAVGNTPICDDQLKPFPDGFSEGTAYYCDPTDAFGNGFYIGTYNNGVDPPTVGINYYGVKKARCMKLVLDIAKMSNVFFIQNGHYFAHPSSTSEVDTYCLATQTLNFQFYLY